MANFCGGIKLADSFKVINGIICKEGASSVDKSKAISVCGQLWDGEEFAKIGKYITLSSADEDGLVKIRTNCGMGVDGRFFMVNGDGVLVLQNGYILTVDATPADATIEVKHGQDTISPMSAEKPNEFLLDAIGDNYTVTVSKDGYTSQTKTVANTSTQTITVTLSEA